MNNSLITVNLSENKKGVRDAIDFGADIEYQTHQDGSTHVETPLTLALEKGNHEIMQAILAAGANPNEWDRLHYQPLHQAIIKGDVLACQLLLEAGADINGRTDVYRGEGGYTPLHFCAWYPNLEIVKLLIEQDADVRLRDKSFPSSTALQTIKKFASPEFARKVVELAKINTSGNVDIKIKRASLRNG